MESPMLCGGQMALARIVAPAENPQRRRQVPRELSEAVRAIRERRGLGREAAAAAAAGISLWTIQRLETGQHSPTIRTLEKLATALGVTTEDFLKNGGR